MKVHIVHIVHKSQLCGISLTFVCGLISGYYQHLCVPKLREHKVTQMSVSGLSGGMVTLITTTGISQMLALFLSAFDVSHFEKFLCAFAKLRKSKY